jgi:hypothetical protein
MMISAILIVFGVAGIEGWVDVKFRRTVDLSTFPLRFDDGRPAAMIEHRNNEHLVTGLSRTGEITSTGVLNDLGQPVGVWSFFTSGITRWTVDVDARIASGLTCPKAAFEQERRTGPEFVVYCLGADGQRAGLEETIDFRGGVLRSGSNLNGKPTGAWATWDDDGKRRLEVYHDGVLDGPLLRWDREPLPVIAGQYVRGLAVGDWTYRCGGITKVVSFATPTAMEIGEWVDGCSNPFHVGKKSSEGK